MLVVCSDTHGTDGPRLSGRTLTAVREAEAVVHAGDFTTVASLEGFRRAADRLHAVRGNADRPAVRERLPESGVVTWRGLRVAVTHRPAGGETGLSMFGRSEAADVVVFGHTHRPTVRSEDPVLLNPGSHADPRGRRPAHAEIRPAGAGENDRAGADGHGDPPGERRATTEDDGFARRYRGRLVGPDGTVFERFRFAVDG